MKQLLLMRHGKSDWNKLGQEDFERPLAKRGRKATQRVATWMKKHDLLPSVALVSTARRTQETWELAQSVFGTVAATENQEELYLASAGDILQQLARVADSCDRAIVLGHNPGMESLAHLLAGPGTNPTALEDLRRGFATAALGVFELAGDSWSRLNTDGARLVDFVRPRDLE